MHCVYHERMIVVEFSVRPARVADHAAIRRLARTLAEFHGQDGVGGSAPVQPVVRQILRAAVLGLGSAVLVAEADGRVVGYTSARLVPGPLSLIIARFSPGAKSAYVDAVVVEDGWRGLGIGSELLEEVCRWARARGAGTVDLQVFEFNSSATTVYERSGWRTKKRTMTRPLD